MVKTCCPGRGRSRSSRVTSGPARAQLCHSGLGARSARLLQRHRPDGGEAQAAPDDIRQLGGHGANWFELIAFYRKVIKYSDGRTGASFFLLASVLASVLPRITHSKSVALPCRFSAARSSLEASSSSLRAFSSRSKVARVALFAASETGSRSAIFLLTSCSSTSKSSLSMLGQRRDIARADPALPQGLALLAERFH